VASVIATLATMRTSHPILDLSASRELDPLTPKLPDIQLPLAFVQCAQSGAESGGTHRPGRSWRYPGRRLGAPVPV